MIKHPRSIAIGAITLLGVAACGERGTPEATNAIEAEPAISTASETPDVGAGWQLLSSGEGVALRFAKADGASVIHLFCPARSGRLTVNVAGFRPIASEERLSFGAGGEAVALVADSRGDVLRGGVTGEAAVPGELGAILAGAISASYGAQKVGPLPLAPEADRDAFLAPCRETPAKPVPSKPAPRTAAACRMQDGEQLTIAPLRAIGTEPFWGARIEGRCVTYSTPDDQAGMRIWTKFSPGADGGVWSGSLDGRQFELRTRKAPGCSDGMSDNRYPVSVTIRVRGETRRGCAEPAS